MRYGCCSNMLAGSEGIAKSEIIEKLAIYGFDYIELSVVDCMRLSRADRLALIKRLDGAGLRSEVVNSLFPRELKTTGPEVNLQNVRDWYSEALELARALGAEYVVYGSPYSKSYPLQYEKERAYGQLLALHRELDEHAGKLGVKVLIEPCHRFECNLINTFEEGVALAKQIGGENTGVLFDYYHCMRNGEDLRALQRFGGEYLKHVHFACPFHPGEPERTFPLDMQEWDYEPFCSTLKGIGYDARISVEAVCQDLDGQATRTLSVMRNLFER